MSHTLIRYEHVIVELSLLSLLLCNNQLRVTIGDIEEGDVCYLFLNETALMSVGSTTDGPYEIFQLRLSQKESTDNCYLV